jgi:hypothetical protein
MTICGYSGRVFVYLKNTQLETKGQQKKPEPVAQNGFSAFLKKSNEVKKATALECITNKIKFGKKLTRDEMEFLKIHNPELYLRAAKIEKEREEYRNALRNCKTKEEARNLHIITAFQPKMESDLKMALFDEFTEFLKSSEFEELPNECELDDESKYVRAKTPVPGAFSVTMQEQTRRSALYYRFMSSGVGLGVPGVPTNSVHSPLNASNMSPVTSLKVKTLPFSV